MFRHAVLTWHHYIPLASHRSALGGFFLSAVLEITPW